MDLFAVVTTVGGFAREDAPEPSVVGVFSDQKLAEQVKILSGFGAKVVPVGLNVVSEGLRQSAQQLGFELKQPTAG